MKYFPMTDKQAYLDPVCSQRLSWPECFVTGGIPEGRLDAQLCADALRAWGNCQAGKELAGEIPEKFGEVMVKIANRLGVTGTPESFSEWSQRWLEENR